MAGGTRPLLRYQALTTLHAQALRGEWKELSLLPVFGKALRTADGEVWVHAGERRGEGTPAAIVVPRASLLVFPAPGP